MHTGEGLASLHPSIGAINSCLQALTCACCAVLRRRASARLIGTVENTSDCIVRLAIEYVEHLFHESTSHVFLFRAVLANVGGAVSAV